MPKRPLIFALCALLTGLPVSPAYSGPTGEVVIEGEAEFSRPDDHTTIIDTSTEQTIVEYDSFDILQGELVKINQPTDQSKIINHVPFGDPTQIGGQLESNGYVYIVNPSGVFVGDTALIDVGGLVAAAGRISYDDFLAGQDHFSELGGEVVVAEGAVVRADDTVALLGQRVANYGTIISQGGMVAFVAGNEAVLGSLDGRMIVRVDGGGDPDPTQFALTQAGTVDAGSGRVLLTAGDTYSLAMNHSGITRGREIQLEAKGDGLVQVAGTLDASGRAPGETGGSVQILGEKIAVLDAHIDASGDQGGGEIRIGGDVQGQGDLRAASRTYVSPLAELVADAIRGGDGGSIVVWADEKTGFYGSASARGGALFGDGGFIEISGRDSLDARGHHIDLSAANGLSGTLLYDPAKIEIRGGSADGSDLDADLDPLDQPDSFDNGLLGQILDNENGTNSTNDPNDPNDDDVFIIYESEIEGTDANIILQATQAIFIDDDVSQFDHQVAGEADGTIVIMPGNSLVIQTTGDPDPNFTGPNDFAIDLGLDVTWQVSEGGLIHISTSAGDTTDLDNSPRANIRVGHLVFGGREFTDLDGLMVPLSIQAETSLLELGVGLVTDTGVNIQTDVGMIVVGSIVANGEDATVDVDGKTVFASSGADVRVTTLSGDILLLEKIETRGGSADPGVTPADGGFGGDVQIGTNDGDILIQGSIDASGGLGEAGVIPVPDLDDELTVSGNGGQGGLIALTATSLGDEAPTSKVIVTGDLIANGGAGTGEIAVDTNAGPIPVSGRGGESGLIDLSADGGVIIQGNGGLVHLEATGGDGQGGGGGSTSGIQSISISVPSVETTPDGGFDVVIQDARLTANGGNAIVGGAGGAGGVGGGILINAGQGSVIASDDVEIEASGGDGAAPTFAGPFALLGEGGTTRSITILGDSGVDVGQIIALGGTGANGNGGLGGAVDISSAVGDVRVGDIDVSGGDATETLLDPEAVLQGVSGGRGGSVFLDTGSDVPIPGEDPVPGGDVLIGGRVVGFGGTGSDADAMATVADGAFMNIRSDAAIEAVPGPQASIEGSTVNLEAPTIGANGPIDIGGTNADDDSALLVTSGSMHVNLIANHGLEDVTVLHTDEEATSDLESDGTPILHVDAAVPAGAAQTITLMETLDTDPTLAFELDARDDAGALIDVPDLVIALDAVHLGAAGGRIRNDDGVLVGESGGAGTAAHVESTGNVVLDAVSIGVAGDAVRVDGAPDASLRLLASGDVNVDMLDVQGSGAFGALDVTQNVATAATLVRGLDAADQLEETLLEVVEVIDPDVTAPISLLTGSTLLSGTDLGYRHLALETSAGAPILRVEDVALGGDGTFSVTGDLELVDTDGASITLASAGKDLLLDAGGDIVGMEDRSHVVMTGGDPLDSSDLVLTSGGSVAGNGGAGGSFLVTENVERLAAGFADDLRISNVAGDADGIEIAQIDVLDPTDLTGETVQLTVTGVSGGDASGGEFVIDNGARRIVLGKIPVLSPSNPATHVSVAGDVTFLSPIELENAQYVSVPIVEDDGSLGTDLVAVNSGRIFSGAGVVFEQAIDTGVDVTAVDDISDPGEEQPDVDVAGSLTVDASGTATYQADVGAVRALALFDTTSALLTGGGTREIHAGDVVFRGALDGPAGARVVGEASALPADDEIGTRVRFGGNVGNTAALASLDVQAEGIHFAVAGGGSAEQVNVAGDVTLATGVATVPAVATITDTAGNLRFQTGGDFTLGALDKLSAVGGLEIVAGGTVTVGDLSASRIEVVSPDIVVTTRPPGPVELADGSILPLDGGVDWVANSIVTSTAPQPDVPGIIDLYVGDGGVSIPGGLSSYRVSYASPSLASISLADFIGQDGAVLDLTGSGPPLVGDPTRSVPRLVETELPEAPPGFGSDAPSPRSRVSADQVLAFLRCSGRAPASGACDPRDEAALAHVDRFRDSALATARAREVTARYRELIASPGAPERLRRAFAEAGRAFGATQEWRDGSLDGAAFYRFLAGAPREQAAALASVQELAWLFTQIDLLGLADADTRRLQRNLAAEFADAAGLQGLDADSLRAAVEASPIGLVQ